MIRHLTIAFCTAACLLLGLSLRAQEQLRPLSANAQLIIAAQASRTATLASRTASVTPMDTLPFFEDFSYSPNSPYPSVQHWLDSNVFINHGFPISPPSIGVATFDGLNKLGYPYNISAPVSSSAQADKLTSRPINLQKKGVKVYSPLDSVWFSFYYQAEGRGDAPEPNDSLCLDFYKPNQKKWEKVWGRKGYNPTGADSLFHLVMLPIKDTAYFDSLFQFRFRNRATLSGSLDHWHVDYIYINTNRSRTDTIIEDLTFEYMATPFLKNYSTMPYRQYIPSEMGTNFNNYLRNNFTVGQNIFYNYSVRDQNNVQVGNYVGGNNNQPTSYGGPPNTHAAHVTPPVNCNISSPLTDVASYTIKHYLAKSTGTATPDFYPPNDTLIQKLNFSNYYAYDDGTAEVGYYNNTYGARNALRFTLNVADTLRAMRIYFDPVVEGLTVLSSPFRIMVWADGSNGPGNLIYQDSLMYPQYLKGSYNQMPVYPLTSCQPLSPGTYYFGIQQSSNKPLNIGFDRNNDHSNALYYDIGGGWTQSAIKGSLMINPMLGCLYPVLPVGIAENSLPAERRITLYPNPAQNSIRINTGGVLIENGSVSILSLVGKTVYSSAYSSSEEIDISTLPNGIYFVQLNATELSATPQKLIIAR